MEITPPLGLAMGGRGARYAPGASVLDPLYGQVTLLEDAQAKRLAIVSLDLIGIGEELGVWLRWAVCAVTGVRPEGVIINASHTHSGPMAHWSIMASLNIKPPELLRYEQELIFRIQRAASQAALKLQPADIQWHDGVCNVGINRRKMVDGEMQMRPNPQGAYNREMAVIEIRTGKDRAVLLNHGCHPVIVYGYCWDGLSADWPGRARVFIREELGADTHVQFLQGFAGDVRPRILADLSGGIFRKSTPQDVELAGREAAASVLAAMKDEGQAINLNVDAAQTYAMISCQAGDPAQAWQDKVDDADELTRNTARYWVKRLADGGSPTLHIPWLVGLARLDANHALAWIAGEPLSEWLGLLREALPGQKLAVLGYTNAVEGYLPRDKHLPEGGYEITRSRHYGVNGPGNFSPGMDAAMTQAFATMARRLAGAE